MLTRRMQLQSICDFMHGIDVSVCQDQLDTDLQPVFEAVRLSHNGQTQSAVISALKLHKDGPRITETLLGMTPGNGQRHFKSMAELAPTLKPITYLWRDWLPLGMLSLLGAAPGAGKSFVSLDLCKRIIAGDEFPDGAPIVDNRRACIYVDAEQVPQILNERMCNWRMDGSNLFIYPNLDTGIDFAIEEHRDTLVEMCHAIDPALIVVDSLGSITTKGENSVEDVRQVLSFLVTLAREFNTAVLLIHHLRKRSPLQMMDLLSIDDFRGSSHIIAMARSVMALSIIQVGKDVDRNGPRRLEIVKTNLNRYPDPIGVNFMPMEPSGVYLKYGEAPAGYHETTVLEKCCEWMVDTLSDGPLSLGELVELGIYSKSTINRARETLGSKIEMTRGANSPDNKWQLADK